MVDRIATATGGAELIAVHATAGLDPERFERSLCATRWSEGETRREDVRIAREVLDRAGVRFLGLKRRSRLNLAAWRELVPLLREADVVHAHMFGSNAWAAVLGSLTRVPAIVAHEHTWEFRGRPLRRLVDRHVIGRLADVFVAVSEEDRRRMVEIEGIPADVVRVIPNGIPPVPPADPAEARRLLGVPAGTPLVGAVGALRPQKAFHVLIEAAALLRRAHPDARVAIVGGGPLLDELRERVAALGLSETVAILGERTGVPRLLPGFDVAVSCSDFEGSPLAVLEYMQAGRPIVATRVGGVSDLIEDGAHGLLVPPGDPAALAEAVGGLLSNPGRAAEMGRRARERQRAEFSMEAMVRRLEALYLELCARQGTRPL